MERRQATQRKRETEGKEGGGNRGMKGERERERHRDKMIGMRERERQRGKMIGMREREERTDRRERRGQMGDDIVPFCVPFVGRCVTDNVDYSHLWVLIYECEEEESSFWKIEIKRLCLMCWWRDRCNANATHPTVAVNSLTFLLRRTGGDEVKLCGFE